MKTLSISFVVMMFLAISAPAFGQSSFATVSGTVSDSTNALIPGVSVTATNVATGVQSSAVTNDSGTYNLPSLLPGVYKLTAELPGFQTHTYTDVQLGNAQQVRLNFTLTVANVATGVEVTVAADTLLSTSSPTIGQVLTQQRVQDLPLVGNNVLDLIGVLSGVNVTNDPIFNAGATTFAGVSASYISTVRDGVMVQDTRWPTGINSATVINPDLVGEIRLILAPVDVEIGRGNGTIQIQTRSGTNQYRGSAVWTVRNTALNPNSWANNRNQPNPIVPNWSNNHQYTVSYGGPIKKNKTFFYTLFDGTTVRTRSTLNVIVLTPCARNGIFRYYDNWNNGNALANTTLGATPTTSVVDFAGNPRPPATNPDGTPHNGILRYASVFGPVLNAPARPDCSDAVVGQASTATGTWDANRTKVDPTGFVNRTLDYMPMPNAFDVNDGLNTAGIRWLRKLKGTDNLFGVGEAAGNRRQINTKIDHNFNARHKANVNVSYERNFSDDTAANWPDTFYGINFRRPMVITAGFTSTLSADIVNEARFGLRRTGTNIEAAFDREIYQEDVNKYLPAQINGFRVIPRLGTGAVSFQGFNPFGNRGGAWPSTLRDNTPVLTYANTLSWTKGKHAFKFGGEFRLTSSKSIIDGPGDFGTNDNYVQAVGGDLPASTPATAGPNSISAQNPTMTGLGTANATRARNLLSFLAGSVNLVAHRYFMTDPKKLDAFDDYRTTPFQTKELKQTEFDFFIKDDYKVHKNLTLNLGVRYEWYGVPFVGSGLTVAPQGGGSALFGVSGKDFSGWMNPGLRGELTKLEFVGPGSPNSGKSAYPNDWNNFGPAVGFAWQLPWFGEGKTTMRGGYQITYQGGGRFSTLDGVLSNPPGSTYPGQYRGDSSITYLDLTNISRAIPAPAPIKPMEPILITDRSVSFTGFDPNYVSPYVQNITLSLTRAINRKMTVDMRYVGTLAVKQFRNLALNNRNFLYNGLIDEFNRIRIGGESPMLDQMFNGINLCTGTLCGTGQFGVIGTTVNGVPQTAAQQMRSSTTFQANLANGNYQGLATSINTLNYVKTGGPNAGLPDIPASVQGAVMRYSGKFPENFIVTNPQFNNVTMMTNLDHNNYHSMQTEVSIRPTFGISGQGTYTWSKNLGLAGALTNPLERHLDYTLVGGNRRHQFRANGVIELPIGPTKPLLGNASGLLARLIERWQMSFIYNASTGSPASIIGDDMLYANGMPDIVRPFPFDTAGVRWGVPVAATGQLNGTYFAQDKFVSVPDPQCSMVTSLQNLSGLAPATGTPQRRCALNALAMIVPAGTPESFIVPDGTNRSAQIVLQNPLPGKRGTLGQNVLEGAGTWRFDMAMQKAFNIAESKSLQVRIDATNVLNHPQPAGPTLDINSNTAFGNIATKTGTRSFQAQLRLTF